MADTSATSPLLRRFSDEPFRLFFPLGTFYCLLGVGYWPLKIFLPTLLANVPSTFHVFMQIEGFLTAFVLGFLGTAAPRLTQTERLSPPELGIITLSHAACVIAIALNAYGWAQAWFFITLVFFIVRLAGRFLRRKRNPPASFAFLPFAFLSALSGSLLLAGFYSGINGFPLESYDVGTALVFYSFPLCLFVGVGGFLIRSLLGVAVPLPIASTNAVVPVEAPKNTALLCHGGAAALIVASYVLSATTWRQPFAMLRAGLIIAEAIIQLGWLRGAFSGKTTVTALQTALTFIVLGVCAQAFAPFEYGIGLSHFLLAGGFGLGTFTIATRVVLSHCGAGAFLQSGYRPFSIAVFAFALACLVRVSADFVPHAYDHHLAYAALAWLVGLFTWGAFVLRRIAA